MKPGAWPTWLPLSVIATFAWAAPGPDFTRIHEPGRCAIRGECRPGGFFTSPLPCPDNGLAEEPSEKLREELVSICGEEWDSGKVCCTENQVDGLKTNLDRAKNIIQACPACKKNFYDLFCTFTCSPDQSLFVNVTAAEPKGDKFMVTELDHLVSNEYGSDFYDSCKEVKIGATGGKAMDFIGGGAKNYTSFLKFLGDKKFAGSPFQMNFPRPEAYLDPKMRTVLQDAKPCNSSDEKYRCACVDCASACAELPAVELSTACHVGILPCLSFAVIIAYAGLIALLILAMTGHIFVMKQRTSKNERLQLLHDTEPDDDAEDDEGNLVHSNAMLDRPTKPYALNTFCDHVFSNLARTCARFPAITISTSVVIVCLLSLGWLRFAVETDPVKLWVAPNSEAAREKAFFDENFGPFFRAEQAFLVNDTSPSGPGPVLSYETLQWWRDVERRVRLQKSLDHGYVLNDVCFKPTGDACVIQSITQYGGSFAEFDPNTWREDLQSCINHPGDCLPEFGQPLSVDRLLGGYNESDRSATQAQALIVTWVVNNYNPGRPELERAEEWEQSLQRILKDAQAEAKDRGLRLSFNTEISLEQELNKTANTDAKIVVISYIVMFIYASLALGSTTMTLSMLIRNPVAALVQSKFMLGVVGILIVLMSVAASVGIFAAAGVKATLIIAEVIPFLVLAVGVDNIFLIVHEFERVNISHAEEPIAERLARALGRMGPSILLSASTETVAFALGTAVGMPAVRNFAAYAAGAVLINALLQVTMFVSVLALNQQRVEAGRVDCVPCIKVRNGRDSDMPNGYGGGPFSGIDEEGSLTRFIRKHYAPTLLENKVRAGVMILFISFFAAGIALLPEIELGLDQRIAIPTGSYVIDYFNDLYDYFGSGPPVYFVARNVNATAQAHQRELCARFTDCSEFSLTNILEAERKRPEVSYIADATASWIDDFLAWLNPEFEDCCVDGGTTCFANRNPPYTSTLKNMPEGKEFVSYAQRWLIAPTTSECPQGGQAPYSDALVVNNRTLDTPAFHFRTAHTPLRSQKDFIDAYAAARRITKDIKERNNIDVFPYSKFYIFFDQYASIVRLSTALVGAALAFILTITSILLGSFATGLIVTFTVTMIVVDIIGTMALADVSLNAVSLVNIVICVGIGVEFCAHIARAFTVPSPAILERAQSKFRGRQARAWAALVNVGGSVFSGITITKLLGVFVLAFTRSKIFEIYYFRVWLALVVWAALHALVFLPVALSLFGGPGYIDSKTDGGLEQDLASRRYRALLPDEEYESDEY